MAHMEIVWRGPSTDMFLKNHLYSVNGFNPDIIQEWLDMGLIAWREDVPPNEVIVDLQPNKLTQASFSKTLRMEN